MPVEIIKNPQIAAMSSRLSSGGKNVPIYKKNLTCMTSSYSNEIESVYSFYYKVNVIVL